MLTELIMKQEAHAVHKLTVKALKRTHPQAERVTIKVAKSDRMISFCDQGWTLESNLSLGRGAGYAVYILSKSKAEVKADLEAGKYTLG